MREQHRLLIKGNRMNDQQHNRQVIIPILLVEDNPQRIKWFQDHLPIAYRLVSVRNGGNALGMLERDSGHVYGGILLDHDLQMKHVASSDRDITGSQVINALIGHIAKSVPILVHSMNLGKAPTMVLKLTEAGYAVTRKSWFEIDVSSYHEWLEEVKDAWDEYHDLTQ